MTPRDTLRNQMLRICKIAGLCAETAESIADDAVRAAEGNEPVSHTELLDIWGEVVRAGDSL